MHNTTSAGVIACPPPSAPRVHACLVTWCLGWYVRMAHCCLLIHCCKASYTSYLSHSFTHSNTMVCAHSEPGVSRHPLYVQHDCAYSAVKACCLAHPRRQCLPRPPHSLLENLLLCCRHLQGPASHTALRSVLLLLKMVMTQLQGTEARVGYNA